MIEVTYVSALLGGVLTFFASCTLPLIPAYVAFIGGASRGKTHEPFSQSRLFLNAALFILGFSTVFIGFGMASGSLGKFLVFHRAAIAQIGGVLIVLFGLSLLGVFSLPSLSSILHIGRLKLPGWMIPGSFSGAFLLGFLFALVWSPCLGPVLGTILVLAGASGSVLEGGLLLATYSLGLAIPFLFVAILYGSTFAYVVKLQKYLPIIARIGAVFIIFLGLLMIIGQFGILNTWMQFFFGDIGLERYMQLM